MTKPNKDFEKWLEENYSDTLGDPAGVAERAWKAGQEALLAKGVRATVSEGEAYFGGAYHDCTIIKDEDLE